MARRCAAQLRRSVSRQRPHTAGGTAGYCHELLDRSSRPLRQPRRLSAVEEERILQARRQTNLGRGRLAGILDRARSTIWKVLRRHGLSRRPRGQRQSYRRYEWSRPGALLHMDVKRLSRFSTPGHRRHGNRAIRTRGAGYDYLHCLVDVECPRFGGQLSAGLSGPAERLSGHATEAEVPEAISAGVSP